MQCCHDGCEGSLSALVVLEIGVSRTSFRSVPTNLLAWLAVDALCECKSLRLRCYGILLTRSTRSDQKDPARIDTIAFSNTTDLDHIKALVHKVDEDAIKGPQVDFVPDKGEGRIILLHGSPGLGKTYTAECVAEWSGRSMSYSRKDCMTNAYLGRPLLRLTCAELGKWMEIQHMLQTIDGNVLTEIRVGPDKTGKGTWSPDEKSRAVESSRAN